MEADWQCCGAAPEVRRRPGLAAAAGARRVTLTDRADCPEILANLATNAKYNSLAAKCEVRPLTWGEFDDSLTTMPQVSE